MQYPHCVVAIGNNQIRIGLIKQISSHSTTLVTVVHPRATVSQYCELLPGCVVFAGSVINIGASLGVGCIVNTGATIEHDCVLGNAVHVSPCATLAGGVRVGNRSWIGMSACVRELVTIGNDVVVGAGSTVLCDVEDSLTIAGTPARELQR